MSAWLVIAFFICVGVGLIVWAIMHQHIKNKAKAMAEAKQDKAKVIDIINRQKADDLRRLDEQKIARETATLKERASDAGTKNKLLNEDEP